MMHTYLKMALVTVGVMFVMNYLSGSNATARKFIRGVSVSPVDTEINATTAMFM